MREGNTEYRVPNTEYGSRLTAHGSRLAFYAILSIYLLLALGYGIINPLFEAPDEHHHYFTAQTIAETWRLPAVEDPPDPLMRQEAAQPPLYYLISALLIAPIDTSDARAQIWINPRAHPGEPGVEANRNVFVHGPWEAWPWHGYALAAHLLRAFSALVGLGTLLAIYGSARLVWPAQPQRALLAMGLVAFLPQFGFLHGAVTNDTLIIFLVALALWQLLRLWLAPPQQPIRNLSVIALGITIGLAALTKNQGLLLALYASAVLILMAVIPKPLTVNRKPSAEYGSRITDHGLRLTLLWLPILLLAGWLWWRNWTLYGDITAANQFVLLAGGDRNYSILDVLGESSGLWLSLFAVFGWFNLTPPDWVYWIWNGLVLLALLGAAWQAVSSRWQLAVRPITSHASRLMFHGLRITDHGSQITSSPRPLVPFLLAGWFLLVYAGHVRFMLQTEAAQGRLLFPALIPLSLALTYGLDTFTSRFTFHVSRFTDYGSRITLSPRPLVTLPPPHLVILAAALLTTAYCLLVTIPRAYARPPLIAEEAIPPSAARFDADLGQGVILVAAELETPVAEPGDSVWLNLYWRASQPIPRPADEDEAIEFVVEIFGRNTSLIGKLQNYHGGGLYPISLWPPGAVVAERVAVPLEPTLAAPTQGRIFVRLADAARSLHVASLKVAPEDWPLLSETVLARLGDGIELASARLSPQTARPGERITVEVIWQVRVPISDDYTTFAHLGDPAQAPLAQGDSPPVGGDYPTRYWTTGEVITDTYTIPLPPDLPPGRYPVHLGMYHPETGARLPLLLGEARQPNDAFLIGWVEIK